MIWLIVGLSMLAWMAMAAATSFFCSLIWTSMSYSDRDLAALVVVFWPIALVAGLIYTLYTQVVRPAFRFPQNLVLKTSSWAEIIVTRRQGRKRIQKSGKSLG